MMCIANKCKYIMYMYMPKMSIVCPNNHLWKPYEASICLSQNILGNIYYIFWFYMQTKLKYLHATEYSTL